MMMILQEIAGIFSLSVNLFEYTKARITTGMAICNLVIASTPRANQAPNGLFRFASKTDNNRGNRTTTSV